MNIWAIGVTLMCGKTHWISHLKGFRVGKCKIDPRGNDFELIPFLIGLGWESC